MNVLIGVLIGFAIYHAVIKPIERKRYREMCIRDGLAPKDGEG